MSFPGFPNTMPRLIDGAPELTPEQRAHMDRLLPHQRAELERTIRNLGAIFEASHATSGMTEAKRAAEIDDANRREPWAKRVAGGRA